MNLKSINWYFIAVNTFAAILMILGARQLFILFNSRILEGLYLYGADLEKLGEFIFQGADGSLIDVVNHYQYGRAWSGLLGVLLSTLVSWTVARRENISKINLLFIFLLGFGAELIMIRVNFDFHYVIPALRDVIGLIGIKVVFVINFILLITLALLLQLNKNLKKYFYQHSS